MLHGVVKISTGISLSFKMDLSKLLRGFVEVVPTFWLLPNKTKLKFDQDFKAFWSFCFELRCLMSQSTRWLGCVVPFTFTWGVWTHVSRHGSNNVWPALVNQLVWSPHQSQVVASSIQAGGLVALGNRHSRLASRHRKLSSQIMSGQLWSINWSAPQGQIQAGGLVALGKQMWCLARSDWKARSGWLAAASHSGAQPQKLCLQKSKSLSWMVVMMPGWGQAGFLNACLHEWY